MSVALDEDKSRKRKHPRHAFIAWFESHPALHLACPDDTFVAELTAHPLYCLASRSSMQHWEVMFRCRAPSHVHPQQWHVYGINVGPRQQLAVLARGGLCEALVQRLMQFQAAFRASAFRASAFRARRPMNLVKCILSRRHFLGTRKNQAECLFQEGQRLYEQQRCSEAAKSWGQAALLKHGASHAFLSNVLFEGRQDVAKDEKRAFELAAAGAAMGCAHSKGALGLYLVYGSAVAKDDAKGLALGRESAAAGSCFGQFVVGVCYDLGWGVAQDDAEAARWYRLAAEQGDADAADALKRLGI